MVHKFLVVGERISLVANRRDQIRSQLPLIEISIPVDVFWEFGEAQKDFDRRAASGEDAMVLEDLKFKMLSILVPYVISEKDRAILMSHIKFRQVTATRTGRSE